MKHFLSIALVVMSSLSATTNAQELDFSQFEDKAYDNVKSELLAKGWQVVAKQDNETSISVDYPEITCGSGSMAICSVGFTKQQHAVALVIVESGNQLIVLGEY